MCRRLADERDIDCGEILDDESPHEEGLVLNISASPKRWPGRLMSMTFS
jgi:hypothetical protein